MIVEFDNGEFDLADADNDGLRAKIFRECRTIPFYGMQQPTPPGCILGMDTILELTDCGQPAKRFLWKLFCGGRLVQDGITDRHGISRSLNVVMPYAGPKRYKLEIIGQKVLHSDTL